MSDASAPAQPTSTRASVGVCICDTYQGTTSGPEYGCPVHGAAACRRADRVSPLLQVTLCGKPLGRPVYADEIADQLAECCGMTSRRSKRRRCKRRRRERMRSGRADS